MKDEPLHPYIEPELEARIVALVLGEASDFEREELERVFEEQPELRLFHDRIESADELLRGIATESSDDSVWKLSKEHRTTVLDTIDPNRKPKIAVEEIDRSKIRRAKFRLVRSVVTSIAVAVVAMLLVVGAAVFTVREAKRPMSAELSESIVTYSASADREEMIESETLSRPYVRQTVDNFAAIDSPSSSTATDFDTLAYSYSEEPSPESIPKKKSAVKEPSFAPVQTGHGGIPADSFDGNNGRFHVGASASFGDVDSKPTPVQESDRTETGKDSQTWVNLPSEGNSNSIALSAAGPSGTIALGSVQIDENARTRDQVVRRELPLKSEEELSFPDSPSLADASSATDESLVFTREYIGGAKDLRGFDYQEGSPNDSLSSGRGSSLGVVPDVEDKVPFLGDLPQVGRLFSKTDDLSRTIVDASGGEGGNVRIGGNFPGQNRASDGTVALGAGGDISVESKNGRKISISPSDDNEMGVPNNSGDIQAQLSEIRTVIENDENESRLVKQEASRSNEKENSGPRGNNSSDPALPSLAKNYVIRLQERVKKADEAALRGSQLMADGDYQGAIDQYRASMDLLPDAPVTNPRRQAYTKQFSRAGVLEARGHAEEGRYPEAIAQIEEILQPSVDPQNIDAKRLIEQLNDPDYHSPALTPEQLERVRRLKVANKTAQKYTELGDLERAGREYHKALNSAPYNLAARRGLKETEEHRMHYYDTAYDHTRAKMLREVAAGWESPVVIPSGAIPQPDVEAKLKSIILPSLEFQETPLEDALSFLQQRSVELDPDPDVAAKGVNLVVDVGENYEEIAETPITLRLTNVPLAEALRYTTALARLEYDTESHAVVIVPHGTKEETKKKKPVKADRPKTALPRRNRRPAKAPAGLYETKTEDEPFSTFSLHVSDVSFKLAQAALAKGEWPDKNTVRIEEFVNAFDYGDPKPTMEEKVACQMEQAAHPFLQQRNILRVSMRTAAQGRNASTPLRLTFLLDNSGSMERSDRQETVRRAFSLLTSQLNENDQVTLISFARQPRLLADKIGGDQGNTLIDTISNLPSEGGTNLEAALTLAYEKAREQHDAKAQNRIILLTDGAANLGNAEPEDLAKLVESMRNSGIAFDAAGIGTEGLNDEILEALTRKGDGRYYLLDRPEDADAGFAKQIAGALHPAAGNVKVQIEFNPNRVTTYKLLGFEKHRLNKEDFRNDKVDAAELAAEEAGVALYQFQPDPEGEGDIGFVSVRFRDMASGEMVERRWPIAYQPNAPRIDQASPTLRLASSAAFLGARLKEEPLGEVVELDALSQFLNGLPQRLEENEKVAQLREMIRKTQEISGR
ncbi:MAG: hypothetical protein CMO55_16005 [Verrucomicrobiales bacterium]|nr:hypothetical protein [Verrucomicrobiales bacterium]